LVEMFVFSWIVSLTFFRRDGSAPDALLFSSFPPFRFYISFQFGAGITLLNQNFGAPALEKINIQTLPPEISPEDVPFSQAAFLLPLLQMPLPPISRDNTIPRPKGRPPPSVIMGHLSLSFPPRRHRIVPPPTLSPLPPFQKVKCGGLTQTPSFFFFFTPPKQFSHS